MHQKIAATLCAFSFPFLIISVPLFAADYEGKYICEKGKILHIPSLNNKSNTPVTMTFVVENDGALTGRIESDVFSGDVEGTFEPTATAPVVNRTVTTRAKIKLLTPHGIFPEEINWYKETFIPTGPYQRLGVTAVRFRASGHSYLAGSMSLPARKGTVGTDILSITCAPPVKEEVVPALSPSEG